MSHRHTSKAWSPSYDRLDTRSNDDAATAKANNERRRHKYVQLRVGRAVLAVQGKGPDSCERGRRGSAVGVHRPDQAQV